MDSKSLLAVAAILVATSSHTAIAADKTWDFNEKRYAPCSGIGVHAAYSIHVRASLTGTTFTALSVTLSSGAFDLGQQPSVSGSLVILNSAGKEVDTIKLTSAWFDVIRSPASDVTLYLPPVKNPPDRSTPQRSFDLPAQGSIKLTVSPVVNVDGGCPLGASTETLAF
jgi:hypothetical protein